MALNNSQREIMRLANEQGYFPTESQAKQIDRKSCDEYGERGGGNPVNNALAAACTHTAIRHVMGEPLLARTIEGLAGDDDILEAITDALKSIAGKPVRIMIRETTRPVIVIEQGGQVRAEDLEP